MDKKSEIYGAQAKILIQYEGTLQELGSKVEAGLNIFTLRYEHMEDEPYDLIGYAEILGFEIELKEIEEDNKWPNYKYCLTAITTDSFEEIFNERMFDISLWMARYFSLMCEVTTMVENSDKQTGESFYWNMTTLKRDSKLVEAKK